MTQASSDLYAFTLHAVRGLCDEPQRVHVEVTEETAKQSTIYIRCAQNDLRFIYGKLREIKTIAIAIAQKHRVIVSVAVDE